MEQQKNCENCIYFYQHYYRSKNGRFHKVYNDGNCINDKLNKTAFKKIISKCLSCEFWEPAEKQSDEKREHIFKVLSDINYKLNEIASILLDDKN